MTDKIAEAKQARRYIHKHGRVNPYGRLYVLHQGEIVSARTEDELLDKIIRRLRGRA